MSVPSTGERTIGNGRYVLLREIGLGGAGVVWRGEDRVIQWLRGQDVRLTSLYPSESRWNLDKEYSHAAYCVASRVDDRSLPTSGLTFGE